MRTSFLSSVLTMSSGASRLRTEDVAADESITFDSLMLSTEIKEALKEMGIFRPSPIQLKTIPAAKLRKSTF